MTGKPLKDEIIKKLDNVSCKISYSVDETGHLISVDFNLEKVMEKVKSNKINKIINFIQNELSFLKPYGYEIEEIIHIPHLFIPDIIFVSFLKPVNDECDWGNILYQREESGKETNQKAKEEQKK